MVSNGVVVILGTVFTLMLGVMVWATVANLDTLDLGVLSELPIVSSRREQPTATVLPVSQEPVARPVQRLPAASGFRPAPQAPPAFGP